MIKDRRPYYLKRLYYRIQDKYVEHFLRPQFSSLGKGYHFIRPWNVEIFGSPITVGKFTHIVCAADKKIKFVIWSEKEGNGNISIGDYCLVSPGVRITSATSITIGNNCMIANGVYISDADWHGIYDRLQTVGESAPVVLKDNVWIGDSAIICKGVTIGENSIVGAGSVVARDIPDNCIAVGNPAKVVKDLDPGIELVKREKLFENPRQLNQYMNDFDRSFLKGNTTFGWLRSIVFPKSGD
ncbi:acyltransferase [bacterium]|nr:acyltransferase [bacterium]